MRKCVPLLPGPWGVEEDRCFLCVDRASTATKVRQDNQVLTDREFNIWCVVQCEFLYLLLHLSDAQFSSIYKLDSF